MDRARSLEDWDHYRPALLRPTLAAAHILSWVEEIDEARALLQYAERELIERGDDGALPFLRYRFAELDCWSGDWTRGLASATEADRLAVQTGQHGNRTITLYGMALLTAHLGMADDARQLAEEGARVAMDAGHGLGIGLNVSVIGFVEHSLGHPDAAHAMFAPVLATARASGFDEPASAWWLADEIEALVALGDQTQAAELTTWLEERAEALDRASGLAAARALSRAAGRRRRARRRGPRRL